MRARTTHARTLSHTHTHTHTHTAHSCIHTLTRRVLYNFRQRPVSRARALDAFQADVKKEEAGREKKKKEREALEAWAERRKGEDAANAAKREEAQRALIAAQAEWDEKQRIMGLRRERTMEWVGDAMRLGWESVSLGLEKSLGVQGRAAVWQGLRATYKSGMSKGWAELVITKVRDAAICLFMVEHGWRGQVQQGLFMERFQCYLRYFASDDLGGPLGMDELRSLGYWRS